MTRANVTPQVVQPEIGLVRTARMCVLPPSLPVHRACNVASNEAEAPGFGYEQVRGSGFGYEQVGDFPTRGKMGGMDSEYLPLHAPTGPHPLRAFSPQVLTFMTRHGPFDHSFFAVRFAVRFGATQVNQKRNTPPTRKLSTPPLPCSHNAPAIVCVDGRHIYF